MQAAQGSLVLIGLNTSTPQVFWNGVQVQGVIGINVSNNADTQRVLLTISEDPMIAELKAAGVIVKRGV